MLAEDESRKRLQQGVYCHTAVGAVPPTCHEEGEVLHGAAQCLCLASHALCIPLVGAAWAASCASGAASVGAAAAAQVRQ